MLYTWNNFTKCFHQMTSLPFLLLVNCVFYLFVYHSLLTISFQYASLWFPFSLPGFRSLSFLAYRLRVFNLIQVIFTRQDLWIGPNWNEDFCSSQDTINKQNTGHWIGEIISNIFTRLTFIFKAYKTPKSTVKRRTNQFFKWAKNLNRHFIKDNLVSFNKYEKISPPLFIEKMQIKSTVWYYYTY